MGTEQQEGQQPHTLDSLFALVLSFREDLINHMQAEEAEDAGMRTELQALRTEMSNLSQLVQAFPHVDGKPDIPGHRNDHETRKAEAKTSAERWESVKTDLLTTVVKGTLYGVILLILLGVQGWVTSFIKAIIQGI